MQAVEHGAHVDLFERAPQELSGGNSRFTAGAMRTVYNGLPDLLTLMPDLSSQEAERSEFGAYSRDDFYDDLCRVSGHRNHPDLSMTLAEESLPTLRWLRDQGIRFTPLYGRQSFEHNGKQVFWGGLTVEVSGGGAGLIDALTRRAKELNVDIYYNARITSIERNSSAESRLNVRQDHHDRRYDAVILACGGFEANAQSRAQFLGPNWDLAKVRGTKFNTGDGIDMAVALGAQTRGHYSGCHAVAWDLNAPEYGDLTIGDGFQKHSYPFGILVNNLGERFLDEGADFRNYTYAKYGRQILQQPDQTAWQIFDQKVVNLLRNEYRIQQVTKVEAQTIAELAKKTRVNSRQLEDTIEQYNRSIVSEIPFNPTKKDGRRTSGITPSKSNWANAIDDPPFLAFGVTCGITFTFGGIAIDTQSRVIDANDQPVPSLYAAGELVGGLFYGNYPGGSGLTSGAVFGRRAGKSAALGL